MNDIPPLPWLRAFEATSRNGNFSSAGDELGSTPAAISHQARSLEEHLGYQLVSREKRPLELTPKVELYLPWVNKVSETPRLRTRDVFGTKNTRPVRIRCLPTFARLWLLKQLPDFRARYPAVNLQLHMGTSDSAIRSNQLDIEIRFGDGDWRGQTATLLSYDQVIPICHPDLRPSGGTLETLRGSPLIEIIGLADNWHQFLRQENLPPPRLAWTGVLPPLNSRQMVWDMRWFRVFSQNPSCKTNVWCGHWIWKNTQNMRFMSPAQKALSAMSLKCF